VLILLTDGVNSPAVPEPLDPEAAARLARDLGVTLHTIAVGRAGGLVRFREPVTGLAIPAEVEGPDLALLDASPGSAGAARSSPPTPGSLAEVFRTIDALEKSPVRGTVRTRYRERYAPWVGLALALLVLDRLLAGGRLRRLP
jgi:Ca-activated chloride channel family protein